MIYGGVWNVYGKLIMEYMGALLNCGVEICWGAAKQLI